MHKHAEIAELLRDFMRGRGKPGSHAQADVNEENAGDRQASEKGVEAVSDQDQICEGLVAFGECPMAVVPVKGLFEPEEDENPSATKPKVVSAGMPSEIVRQHAAC